MLSGVPEHVDGRMIGIAESGRRSGDQPGPDVALRRGHTNWNPVWPMHGIRILPGPSSLWLDATGKRLPAPLYPGFDTLGTLEHLRDDRYDYSWFVLTQRSSPRSSRCPAPSRTPT